MSLAAEAVAFAKTAENEYAAMLKAGGMTLKIVNKASGLLQGDHEEKQSRIAEQGKTLLAKITEAKNKSVAGRAALNAIRTGKK